MFGDARLALNPDGQRKLAMAVMLAAGVFAGVAFVSLIQLPSRSSRHATIASLASLSHSDTRPIEPRLSGFGWAPHRARTRGAGGGHDIDAAMGEILETVRGATSAKDRHLAGVAQLLAGDPRGAIGDLNAAAEAGNTASFWSDLAAAHYQTAVSHDVPEPLAESGREED